MSTLPWNGHDCTLPLVAKHRRVPIFEHLAVSEIHVDAARQARIETANRTHDIDAFELVWAILFENWRVLDGVFVWTRRSINVTRVGVPRRWRIRMVVCDFAVANNHVVRKHAANSFVEAASNRILRDCEFVPGARATCVEFCKRLFHEIECAGCG